MKVIRPTGDVSTSRLLALTLAAAVAVGCASGGGSTTTTSSGGDVDQPRAAGAVGDTAGRVPPATGGINPTANPPALGPGVTGSPTPGSPAVASRDSSPGGAGVPSGAGTGNANASVSSGVSAETGAGSAAMGARSDANIVALLHESNVGEIQAGTLAQQRATNSAVKSFAQQMVTEHTTLDQRGNALAQQAGIAPALPDSTLPNQQRQEASQLQGATGSGFDRAYIAQQVAAHQRTLALVDASIPIAQNAQLKTMLQSEVRPRVAAHLQTAQNLQRQVGTSP